MEWKLFDGPPPFFTEGWFFAQHPWVDPVAQRGHAARTDMVADLVAELVEKRGIGSATDLGCGDGALMQKILRRVPALRLWGYDLGRQNLHVATTLRGVDARSASLDSSALDYGDLLIATEVVEHLADPYSYLRGLPGSLLVLSSPYDEDDKNHYEHHAWAWDEDGYRALAEACGWTVTEQRTCPEGFQAIVCERDLP
jgi:trans-aconitate methyltransferase